MSRPDSCAWCNVPFLAIEQAVPVAPNAAMHTDCHRRAASHSAEVQRIEAERQRFRTAREPGHVPSLRRSLLPVGFYSDVIYGRAA